MPGGAAARSRSGGAYVLIDDGDPRRFGPALAWAVRSGASALQVLVDGSATGPGIVGRRAECFLLPVGVWAVSGRTLQPAAPAPMVGDFGAAPAELVSVLSDAGLEVAWEHGVLTGEVLGLEVARTVGDSIEVGVGRHDRMARHEMRPSEPLSAALVSAASAVSVLRRPDAPVHPANTLARSRWLRSLVVAAPGSVGCASLTPMAPPLPAFDLTELGAAPTVGTAMDGSPVVVVCSVGVDLDLVPTGADARLAHSGGLDVRLVLVVPEGDDLPITHQLAGLVASASVVTVPRGWPGGLDGVG